MTRAQIKHIRLLSQKKFRKESGLFIVEGPKMVEELLSSEFEVVEVFSDGGWPNLRGVQVVPATPSELNDASGMVTSPGVIAIIRQKIWPLLPPSQLKSGWLLLDGVSDPGNLGSIIRSAEWFGVQQVICSTDSVELYNPKVVQATMGSLFRVPVCYAQLEPVIQELRDAKVEVYGADAGGIDYRKVKVPTPPVIVIGSESHGISNSVKSRLTSLISIPGKGKGESLNASVAAAVLLAGWSN